MKKLYAFSFILCLFFSSFCKAQYTDLHDFNDTGSTANTNGVYPFGNVLLSGNVLYGLTYNSGVSDFGSVFSIHTDGSHYKDLLDFTSPNGSFPYGSLTLVGHKLYGMTEAGGTHNMGTIFSIDTNGSGFTLLWSFTTATGNNSYFATLAFYKDKLYGMTKQGGANNDGVVFSFDTITNTYTDLFDFNGTNGKDPEGSIVVSGNRLYGTTFSGGTSSEGNIFSMDTNGNSYKDLLNFTGAANGSYPEEGQLQISGKKMFGMTEGGGLHSNGILYSIDTNGNNFKTLYAFTNNAPDGSLVILGDLLFGMTYAGGTNNDGIIFVTDTTGNGFTDLFDFNGTNGKNPSGDVILSNGTLYGMTRLGGANNYGLIFSDDLCGGFTASKYSKADNGANNGIAAVTASGGVAPYSYSWQPGGSTADTIKNLSAGTYTCTIMNAYGCQLTVTDTVKSLTGISTLSNTPMQNTIYPNPSNGVFNINIENHESGITYQVDVYNMLGEKVYSKHLTNVSTQIDLSQEPRGVYFYFIESENGQLKSEGKLIIE